MYIVINHNVFFQLGGNNDSKHFLLYYYYGGMIYTAIKSYDRALYFFEVVVTVPAMVVSHIMLEAYKKYILVSLILHGKVRYTDTRRWIKYVFFAACNIISNYSNLL